MAISLIWRICLWCFCGFSDLHRMGHEIQPQNKHQIPWESETKTWLHDSYLPSNRTGTELDLGKTSAEKTLTFGHCPKSQKIICFGAGLRIVLSPIDTSPHLRLGRDSQHVTSQGPFTIFHQLHQLLPIHLPPRLRNPLKVQAGHHPSLSPTVLKPLVLSTLCHPRLVIHFCLYPVYFLHKHHPPLCPAQPFRCTDPRDSGPQSVYLVK